MTRTYQSCVDLVVSTSALFTQLVQYWQSALVGQHWPYVRPVLAELHTLSVQSPPHVWMITWPSLEKKYPRKLGAAEVVVM